MFKPVSMKKVNIFVLNEDVKKISDILYELKLIEFFEVKHDKFDKYEQEDLNKLSGELLKIRSTITYLKGFYKKSDNNFVNNPNEKVHDLKVEHDDIVKKISSIEDSIKREGILSELKVDKTSLDKYTIGFVSFDDAKVLKEFDKKGVKYTKIKHDNRIYFAFDKSKKVDFKYKEFYLPKEKLSNLEKELYIEKQKLRLVDKKLISLANGNLLNLQREELKLSKELSTIEAKGKFAKTTNFTVLSGYVPSNMLKNLNYELKSELANKYEIEVSKAGEDAPVNLDNGLLSNKFEALLRMYSLPKYSEIDPSFLIMLVFPIFFGFILGDVGYGLISLLVFTFAKMKFKQIKDFLSILQLSAVSSMVFGVIYGEYFGFEPYHLFARAQNPELLLLFAVIFGVVHINLGLIIGFINELGNLKKAICDKLSWIILQFAVGILSLGIYAAEETAVAVGSVFLLLSVVLIYMGHGFIGIIEIPSFFTNILSYARLMAVGLSSIAIAVLVNEYSMLLFSKGILGIVGGIFLFTFGHIFNIVLGNFESFLHTLRLHYVEFFTKFYTGGGREFKPFGHRIHEE